MQDPDVLGQDRVSDPQPFPHGGEVGGLDGGEHCADLEAVRRVHDLVEACCGGHRRAWKSARSALSVQRPNTMVTATASTPATRNAPLLPRSRSSQQASATSELKATICAAKPMLPRLRKCLTATPTCRWFIHMSAPQPAEYPATAQ